MALAGKDMKLNFITGVGRSGTTVLTQLLNRHPAVHCLPEANFMLFFLHSFGGKTSFSSADVDLVFEQIDLFELSHPWVGWTFDKAETRKQVDAYVKENEKADYTVLCKIIYRNFKVAGDEKAQAGMLVDKNPSYTLFMSPLSEAVKEAKFIHIIRDYRANILSRKQSVYLESPHVAYNAIRWLLFNKKALRFGTRYKDKFLFLRYEDLARDADGETQKVCRFLGVDASLKLSSLPASQAQETDSSVMPEKFKKRFEKKYTDLSKPVNANRIDSWKEQLSKREIMTCDAICGNFAKELGYEFFTPLSGLKIFFLRLSLLPVYLWAWYSVEKEYLIYRLDPRTKLKRLRKVYQKHGFNA